MTGIPLRRRLFLLIVVGIVPVASMAGAGLYALVQQQNAQAEQVGLELSRSVANAIETELRSIIAALETLASTPALDRGDVPAFEDVADRVVARRTEWAAISLADRSGTVLADTRSVEGEPLRPLNSGSELVDSESFTRVLQVRAPVVGSLTRHSPGGWLFAVRVPVVERQAVRYVVTALVKPDAILDVLTRQDVPEDWVISIIDANGLRVARSRAHEENLGGRLSDTVQQVVDRGGTDGFGLAYALEGERIYTPYSRLAFSGWTAVLGLPTAALDAATSRSVMVYGGGVLLSVLLGGLGAAGVARSITRPISDLRSAAAAVGRRERPQQPRTRVQEIREVGGALTSAAEALAEGDAQREQLLAQERRARAQAEEADQAKEEFMAVVSHELRTPLNAVYGWARMLQAGAPRDPALMARAYDAIVRNAHLQVQLIDDLLDFSRITSGKMRLNLQQVDMLAVLQGALDAVRPAAEAKGVQIVTSPETGTEPVTGDPARLQQVLCNLLMNSVKFTPKGGFVRLLVRHADSHIEIVVEDSGQGIAPEILPHVFERFRQGDSSSTRAHGGLGLGLALVKHLVELHGGTVVARSPGHDRGATFTVTLPMATVAPSPGPSQPRATSQPATLDSHTGRSRLDGLRVLVVDDDCDAVELAKAILTSAGADVRTCLTGAEALQVLRSWRPDVLVSDIEMPGEDGYALIRKVRGLSAVEGGHTPAIALSAYGRQQDRLRAVAAGFTMHVPKPVDPGELTTIVASVAGVSGPT